LKIGTQGHPDATALVQAASQGNHKAADDLMGLVYNDLRGIADRLLRRERPDHTLQPTALVHEAYMRLVDQTRVDWQGRTHFLAVAARKVRHILVDHARSKKAAKRGGNRSTLILDENMTLPRGREVDVLGLDEALNNLFSVDERAARVVELRFFSGMTQPDVAKLLGVSERTVRNDWTWARTWLQHNLDPDNTDE